MQKVSHKNVARIARSMDRLAEVIEKHASLLGLNPKSAREFISACDRTADIIEAFAGIEHQADFDASSIGDEVSGPLEQDSDESYMKGEFTQEENTEVQNVTAGKKRADFDAAQIGKQVPGPKEKDADEPYMNGEFTQEEFANVLKWQNGRSGGKTLTAAQIRNEYLAYRRARASRRAAQS